MACEKSLYIKYKKTPINRLIEVYTFYTMYFKPLYLLALLRYRIYFHFYTVILENSGNPHKMGIFVV